MKIFSEAKHFFGLAPQTDFREDEYFDEPRYETRGSAAYAPEYERGYRADGDVETAGRSARRGYSAGASRLLSEEGAYSTASPLPAAGAAARRSAGASVATVQSRNERPAALGGERVNGAYAPGIVSVLVHSFNDCPEFGAAYRDGDAVTFELTELPSAEARRVVDFAAGVVFALGGHMAKISGPIDTDRVVFGIIPDGTDMTVEELQRAVELID